MVVAEEVQPRPHRRQRFVDDGLAGIDPPAGRIERTRRFVRQEDIDVPEPLADDDFVADEVAPLVVAALPQLQRDAVVLRPLDGGSAAAGE